MHAKFAIGWRQVGAALLTLALTSLITSSFSIMAVPMEQEYDTPRKIVMMAMTVVSGVSALLSPTIGKMLDRFNLRLAVLIGTTCLSLGFLAISAAPSFTLVLVIYGALIAPANVLLGPMAVTVLLSRWFVKRRGTAVGVAITGIAIGNFFFPPTLQKFIQMWEWRSAIQLVAGLTFIIGLLAAAMIINRPSDRGAFPDGADAEPDVSEAKSIPVDVPTGFILKDMTFWLIAMLVATVTAGMKGMVTNLMAMANDANIPQMSASFLLSAYAGGAFIGKLVFAAYSDKLHPHVTMRLSLAGYCLGTVAMAFSAGNYWALGAGVVLMGFFGGMMVPMESYLIPRIYGREIVGRVGGWLNLAMLSVLLISPPLFGWIFDETGSYQLIFLIFAGLAVVSFGLVSKVRTERRELPASSPSLGSF